MKSNGTKYVVAVFALLAAYFVYVWWLSPTRAVKRQLGELAGALSVPAHEADIGRVTRLAQLRRYFAEDVHLMAGKGDLALTSRDALLAVLAGMRPPPDGWNVQFVDVQVTVDSATAARAYMTVEVTGRDARTGERTLDAREARLKLENRSGAWVITSVESPEALETTNRS